MIKYKLLSFFTVAAMIIFLFPQSMLADINKVFLYEDFEGMTIGACPEGFTVGETGGSVRVRNMDGNKVAELSNSHEGVYTSLEYAFSEIKDTFATVQLDYMQNDVKADNNVILAVNGSEGEAVVIQTFGGNIVYKTTTGHYKTLISDYLPNIWYQIKLEINLALGVYDVYINGSDTARGLELLKTSGAVSSIRSYTCYSPGYYLDNLVVSTNQVLSVIEISGKTEITIPKNGESEYYFTAKVYDSFQNPVIDPELKFSLLPVNPTGITLTEEAGNKLKLTVYPNASPGNITISAEYEADNITGSLSVSLQSATVGSIEIAGPAKIGSYNKNLNSYEYSVRVLDQLGNEMPETACLWSLEGADIPSGVTINPQTGVISVSTALPKDKRFFISAVSADNPLVASKKQITMLNWDTYIGDMARLNTLKLFAEKVITAGADKKNGTPLVADGLDISTELPVQWIYPPGQTELPTGSMSNLAEQGSLMRALYALTDLTGDTKYKQRVMDIYQYYLDNCISANGLIYWGGHTYINLDNAKPFFAPNDPDTHELKNHFPFMEPLYKLNPDAAEKMTKAVWTGHMKDYKTLLFNRHARYSAVHDIAGTFDNPSIYDPTPTGLIKSQDLPFRSAGSDFIDFAVQLYEHTGNKTSLQWAYWMWKKYDDVSHPETHLPAYQFTTANGADGTLDPLTTLEPIGAWWLANPMPAHYTWTQYGDRFKNQFADDLISEGIVPEEKRDFMREANLVNSTELISTNIFVESDLAKALGLDTPEGKLVMDNTIKALSSYKKYAYVPETNQTKRILTDGTDLSSFVLKKSGYYGEAGTVLRWYDANVLLMQSYAEGYIVSEGLDHLSEERRDIWHLIKAQGKYYGLGNLGDDYPGQNMKIDLNTSCNEAHVVMALSMLYDHTKNVGFLDLARRVADNMIKDKFMNDMFVAETNYVNAHFGGFGEIYAYALVMLEAASQGDINIAPEYIPYGGYYQSNIMRDNGRIEEKTHSTGAVWQKTFNDVKVTHIIPEAYEISLSLGEERAVNITIEPDDAKNKNVIWSSQSPGVARMSDNTIYAISEGEAYLYGVSEDTNARVTLKVVVETE